MSRRKPCGVCAAASSARSTASTTCASATRLIVSMTGSTGRAPDAARIDRGDHALEDGGRGQRPRRVVDEHDLDIAPQRGEPARDRLLPGRAAGDDRHEVTAITGRCERVGQRVAFAPARRDDDDLRERTREDPRQGMPEDAVLVDADERLRTARRRGGYPTRPRRR